MQRWNFYFLFIYFFLAETQETLKETDRRRRRKRQTQQQQQQCSMEKHKNKSIQTSVEICENALEEKRAFSFCMQVESVRMAVNIVNINLVTNAD